MIKKLFNMFKPGTAKYYRDMLELIVNVAFDYDGYNPKSAKQMKELVDELRKMAIDALNHKKLYCGIGGKNVTKTKEEK